MQTRQEILSTIYNAFNDRQIETVLAALHPDVDWPNGMEGGRVLGRNNVRDYWTRQWAVVDPIVKPVGIAEDANGRFVVDVHQVVRDLSGKILLDQMIQHVYDFQDDLIVRMDIQERAAANA